MATVYQKARQLVGSSFGAEIVTFHLEKAIQDARDKANAPMSTFYDPMELFMGREWVAKQATPLTFNDLRAMTRNPIIGSIIQTRLNQLATFCLPQNAHYDYGFMIKPKNPTPPNPSLDELQQIRDAVSTCGEPGYGDYNLEVFIRKFMRDSLVLDQAAAEVVQSRNGMFPSYFVAVDASTIRLTQAALDFYNPVGEKIMFVQMKDDQILTKYKDRQMMFGVRNPFTDLKQGGYGMSELEYLLRTITLILNTEKYNSGMLQQGGIQKGILVVKGEMAADDRQFEAFKRDFREAYRNASDYWRAPVLRIGKDGDVNWETLDKQNRDMEYAALFDFLVKQSCGVYQMSPEEINWSITPTGTKVNFAAGTSGKITASQQKGLKPLLGFLANQLNIKFVEPLNPDAKLEFVGLETDRVSDSVVNMREVQNYKTINEVRKSIGLPPIEGGDVIMNAMWMKMMDPTLATGSSRDPQPGERDVEALDPENDTSKINNLVQ